MYKDNIVGLFFRYTLPSVASMMGISLYILADTFFIANGVGSHGLTALNIILPVYSLIHGVGLLIGIGGATVFSIAKAANSPWAKQVFSLCLVLTAAATGIFTFSGVFFSQQLAQLLGASEQVLALSSGYLKVLSLFSGFFLLNNLISAFVRNDSSPGLAMTAMLAGTMLNIILDYLFIMVFGWGMFGAALATGSAPVLGLLILSYHFIRKRNTFSLSKFRPKLSMLTQIAQGGSSSFIIELSSGVVIMAFNFALLRAAGDIGVAAYGIIANIALVCTAIFTGLGQGMQPIISTNYGAGYFSRCKNTLLIGIITALGAGTLFFVIGLRYTYEITGLFNLSGNPQLTAITVNGIRIYFVGFILSGVNIIVSSYFQATLNSASSMSVSLCRGLFAIIVGLTLLPMFLGIDGVWATVPFAEIIAFGLAMGYTLQHLQKKSSSPISVQT